MSQIITFLSDNAFILLVSALVAVVIKFSDTLKAVKNIFSFVKKRQDSFYFDKLKPYLKREVNQRFGFSFINIQSWDRQYPYNGDGCSIKHPGDGNIKYSVSGGRSHAEQEDFLELSIKEQIQSKKEYLKKFKLLSSGKTACDISDLKNGEAVRNTSLDAWRIVYTFQENKQRLKVIEKIILFKEFHIRIYFQAPHKEFKKYEELYTFLLAEFCILEKGNVPHSEIYDDWASIILVPTHSNILLP